MVSGNYNIADGISQTERFPVQLADDFFLIDGKTTGELLKFATALANQINYYNFHDEQDGTWESFFDSDIDVLAAIVLQFDLSEWMSRYDAIKEQILQANTDRDAIRYLNMLFKLLYDCSSLMSLLREKLSLAENNQSAIEEIDHISVSFTQVEADLLEYSRQAASLYPHIIRLEKVKGEPTSEDSIFKGEDAVEQIQTSLTRFDELFAELRLQFGKLYKAIEFYSTRLQLRGEVYQPHMALFVAFLDLYKYLQTDINKLVKKHLDFYFTSLLGIKYYKQQLQYLLLVMEPAVATVTHVLPVKELVYADLPDKQTIWYETEEELTVLKTSIAAIRNIYISKHVHKAVHRLLMPLTEHIIYCGDYRVINPSLFAASPATAPLIPVLGEDQILKSTDEKTMQEAAVGFVIGSSILYVRDGLRTIYISFSLSDASFEFLGKYVESLAHDIGQASQTALFEVLNTTFSVEITGDTSWITIRKVNISVDKEAGVHSIVIKLQLNPEDPPVNVYNPLLHGDNYRSVKPLIRFLLNNRSLHNGYSLFSTLVAQDVTIKVEVKNSSAIRLRNNFGELSANAPFQPFGPVPATGSYLDIRNTNIFNKFVTDFSFNIEWFDLPKSEGGFEAYFAAYGNHIKNDSFKVGMSTFREGWFQPASSSQQLFNLFSVDESKGRSKNFLCRTTLLKDVNLRKLIFANEPLLNNEEKNNNPKTEGVVRIELLEPEDPFGHKTYQVVFPEVILHNSKKLVKKRPLPNQPYIPVIKNITVSYTQQKREVLRQADAVSDEFDIEMIHIHPFGYESIYPSAKMQQYTFLKPMDHPANLIIGLKDAIDDSVLTLLFELEETSFKYSTWQPDPIEWSYLDENDWVFFKPSNILSDSTENFIKTGTLKIRIPVEVNHNHTILPAGTFWLRASCNSLSIVANKLKGIFPNVVKAVFSKTENDSTKNALFAPPGSIKDFKRKMPQVQKIWNFYGSVSGRTTETEKQYYVRVSERLRHKQRPLSALDIAQFVLQSFPDLQLVKCLEADKQESENIYPVDVKVIVVPRKKDGNVYGAIPQVSLSELLDIKKLLQSSLSSFASVDVGNPVYETIKINCTVVFNKDKVNASDGYLMQLLNEDIKQMIAPWLYGDSNDVKIGAPIYVADVINYIKKRDYIKFVTEVSVLHFYQVYNTEDQAYIMKMSDTAVGNAEQLSPSRPDAVFIPSEDHLIEVVKDNIYEQAAVAGIGNLLLGKELLISEPAAKADDKDLAATEEEEPFAFTVKI